MPAGCSTGASVAAGTSGISPPAFVEPCLSPPISIVAVMLFGASVFASSFIVIVPPSLRASADNGEWPSPVISSTPPSSTFIVMPGPPAIVVIWSFIAM